MYFQCHGYLTPCLVLCLEQVMQLEKVRRPHGVGRTVQWCEAGHFLLVVDSVGSRPRRRLSTISLPNGDWYTKRDSHHQGETMRASAAGEGIAGLLPSLGETRLGRHLRFHLAVVGRSASAITTRSHEAHRQARFDRPYPRAVSTAGPLAPRA